jgi:hypothetical protein
VIIPIAGPKRPSTILQDAWKDKMIQNGRLWLVVRICWMLIGFLQAKLFLGSMTDDFSHASWSFPFEMSAVLAIGLLFILSFQANRLRTTEEKWLRPSWRQNPFSYKQPLLFFDASAYYMLALASGCAALGLSRAPMNWAWELPFAIGCGLWIGVRLCMIAFPKSLQPANGSVRNLST